LVGLKNKIAEAKYTRAWYNLRKPYKKMGAAAIFSSQ
jgi:hypothetical protein